LLPVEWSSPALETMAGLFQKFYEELTALEDLRGASFLRGQYVGDIEAVAESHDLSQVDIQHFSDFMKRFLRRETRNPRLHSVLQTAYDEIMDPYDIPKDDAPATAHLEKKSEGVVDVTGNVALKLKKIIDKLKDARVTPNKSVQTLRTELEQLWYELQGPKQQKRPVPKREDVKPVARQPAPPKNVPKPRVTLPDDDDDEAMRESKEALRGGFPGLSSLPRLPKQASPTWTKAPATHARQVERDDVKTPQGVERPGAKSLRTTPPPRTSPRTTPPPRTSPRTTPPPRLSARPSTPIPIEIQNELDAEESEIGWNRKKRPRKVTLDDDIADEDQTSEINVARSKDPFRLFNEIVRRIQSV
jgi:hypothetical protein